MTTETNKPNRAYTVQERASEDVHEVRKLIDAGIIDRNLGETAIRWIRELASFIEENNGAAAHVQVFSNALSSFFKALQGFKIGQDDKSLDSLNDLRDNDKRKGPYSHYLHVLGIEAHALESDRRELVALMSEGRHDN